MKHRLKELQLNRFRGASGDSPTTIPFDASKKVVLIFGENGTGKSTVVDAIDAVVNRSAGSLRNRSLKKSREGYLTSLGAENEDTRIGLATAAGRFEATLQSGKVQVEADPQDAELPTVHILRRSDLLKLIEVTPKERFDEVRKFIDVGPIETCEQHLRDLVRAVTKEQSATEGKRDTAHKTLRDSFADERQPDEAHDDAVEWATERTRKNVAALQRRETALADLGKASEALERARGVWEQATRQATLAEAKATEAARALASAAQADGAQQALLGLLTEAQSYFAATATEPADTCPLCEQDDERARLAERTRQRLAALATVRTLVQADRTAKRAKDTTGRARLASAQGLRSALAAAETRLGALLPEDQKALGLPTRQLAASPPPKPRQTAEEERTEPAQPELDRIQALLALHPSAREEERALRAEIEHHNNLQSQLAHYRILYKKAESLAQLRRRAERALGLVVERRKAFLLQILDAVKDEVNALYQAIHPGEQSWLDHLKIERRASLDQRVHFQGHTVEPQGYFSESHLDTFGFCLWLALAKRQSDGTDVLVLDDVFTSVDAPHRRKIIALLWQQTEHFSQVILATHRRTWQNEFVKLTDDVCLLVLRQWNLGQGVRADEGKSFVDELRHIAETYPLDRQGIASKAGVLLEMLLDDASILFACRMARQAKPAYGIGELVSGTTKVFRKAKVRRFVPVSAGGAPEWGETDLKETFEEVIENRVIRNQVGAHANADGLEYTDAEVQAVAEGILKLAGLLYCPRCGHMPSNKHGDHWRCRCKKNPTELRPLRAP